MNLFWLILFFPNASSLIVISGVIVITPSGATDEGTPNIVDASYSSPSICILVFISTLLEAGKLGTLAIIILFTPIAVVGAGEETPSLFLLVLNCNNNVIGIVDPNIVAKPG